MSFKENPFAIILGAATAIIAGGLIYWGMLGSGKYAEAKQSYDGASSTIQRLMRQNIQPTPENLRAKTAAVETFAESVEELQKAFDPLRRPTLQNIEPSEYTDRLLETRQRLRTAYEEAGAKLPDPFFAGHKKFSDTLPLKEDTGVLAFELNAFEDLLTRLAAAGPDSLDNVYWPGIPEVPEDARAVAHPIEVTFTGSEGALRRYLEQLDQAEEHYFVIRSMRVVNDRTSAPNAQDARFPEPADAAGTDGNADPQGAFESFFDEPDAPIEEGAGEAGDGGEAGEAGEEGEVPEPDPAADPGTTAEESTEILKQVLGKEKIHVFMRIDVMQFLEPQEL